MSEEFDLPATFMALSKLAKECADAAPSAEAIENKGSVTFDPVTALDRSIELAMRNYILSRWPLHGVWGEEGGWSNHGATSHWSIDPVDGTRALICGLPTWCVLVGFLSEGRHVAAMIDCPPLKETLVCIGERTTRNGLPVATSGCEVLSRARLSTTDPFLFSEQESARFAAFRDRAMLTRYGLDSLAYARVATGDLDLVVESGLKRHDLDALIPVVRGAGGFVGDWTGGEDWESGSIVAASSKALYDEALAILSR